MPIVFFLERILLMIVLNPVKTRMMYRADSKEKVAVPRAAKAKIGPLGLSTPALYFPPCLLALDFVMLCRFMLAKIVRYVVRKIVITRSGSIN